MTKPPTFEARRAHCEVCGHEWVPRVERPRVCPKCKNDKWWEPRENPKDQKSNVVDGTEARRMAGEPFSKKEPPVKKPKAWGPNVYFVCAICGKDTYCAKDPGKKAKGGALVCSKCAPTPREGAKT